jgi:hypothetical protein
MNKCIKISHKNLPAFVIIFFLLDKFGLITKGNCELLIHNILSHAHFVIQIDVENVFKLISKVIKKNCFGQRHGSMDFFHIINAKFPCIAIIITMKMMALSICHPSISSKTSP